MWWGKTVNVLVPGEFCPFVGPGFCTGNHTRSQGSCQTLLGLRETPQMTQELSYLVFYLSEIRIPIWYAWS